MGHVTINNRPAHPTRGTGTIALFRLFGEQPAADALPSTLSRLLRRSLAVLNPNLNIGVFTIQVLKLFAQLTPNR